MENEQEEVIVDDLEDTNEEAAEDTEEKAPKASKPKRTPQEELEYFEGRAARLRSKLGVKDEPEESKPAKSTKSSDLDYGQKAFLHAHGIKGPDELELVKNWTGRTGDSLDQVVEDDIFISKLSKLREAKATAEALPKQSKRSTVQITDDVDYWMDKPFEDVPTKFKVQVLNKRVEKEKGTNMFSSNPIVNG